MLELLDINNVFFTVLDYPMSYLEFFGTLFNLACVILVMRKNILTWPVGIVGVVLFAILFYQIQLYSDLVEQGYYLITGLYGWWLWTRVPQRDDGILGVRTNNGWDTMLVIGTVIVGTMGVGYFMSNIHLYFPAIFPEPASFPYLDAITTVMSFAAQWLMAHKRLESWMLWIAVDVIGVILYGVKGVMLLALLYGIFLVLAINGYRTWRKEVAHADDRAKGISAGKLHATS